MNSRVPYSGPPKKHRRPLPILLPPPIRPDRIERLAPAALSRPPNVVQRILLQALKGPLDHAASTALTHAFYGYAKPVTVQIKVLPQRLDVGLLTKSSETLELTRLLRGVVPQWDVTIDDEKLEKPRWPRRTSSVIRTDRPDYLPFKDVKSFSAFDPLNTFIQAVQPLEASLEEEAEFRFLLRPISQRRFDEIRHQLTYNLNPLMAFFMHVPKGPYPRFAPALQEVYEERLLDEPLFEMVITITLSGGNRARLQQRSASLSTAFWFPFNSGPGGFALQRWRWWRGPQLMADRWPNHPEGVIVNAAEAAALVHPPSDQVFYSGASYLKFPNIPLPHQVTDRNGLRMGTYNHQSVSLKLTDLQLGHLVCVGKTRVGKTTLAHQMLHQIKQQVPDSSLVLFDPTGDFAVDYVARSTLPERAANTWLVELGDTEFPPRVPLLEPPPGVSLDTFIKITFETIKLIWRDRWFPRMETILFRTIAALAQTPNATLKDFERLYTQPTYLRRVVARLRDESLVNYWLGYAKLPPSEQFSRTDPILSRVSVFTQSEAIANIICPTDTHANRFDIASLVNEGSDVVISTAGVDIHNESDLLIEFLIARLHLAMFARLGTKARRRPVFLAIDEAQHIKGPSLPVLFSEAAKTGLCVIALNQYMDQWEESLAQSILGNVGTTVAFAVGAPDAHRLSGMLRPFSPHDAEDLDKFQAFVRTRVDGTSIPTFPITTLPIDRPADEQILDTIRKRSRQRFTRPAASLTTQRSNTPMPEMDELEED